MSVEPFNWTKPHGAADEQQLCEWHGMALWADMNGEWRVVRMGAAGKRGAVLVTHEDQAPGTDIDDAKRRAQAAAIIQRDLQTINSARP